MRNAPGNRLTEKLGTLGGAAPATYWERVRVAGEAKDPAGALRVIPLGKAAMTGRAGWMGCEVVAKGTPGGVGVKVEVLAGVKVRVGLEVAVPGMLVDVMVEVAVSVDQVPVGVEVEVNIGV
jgi:hypothetical protein